ncbi:MAG TPA: hypothetical protein VFK14_10960 [Solirubrobacterales bacterium]|nr:hypothetical protein [Solirubrobacterales bacterium]
MSTGVRLAITLGVAFVFGVLWFVDDGAATDMRGRGTTRLAGSTAPA